MEVSVKIFWYGVERYGFQKVLIAAMNNILKQKPIEQIGEERYRCRYRCMKSFSRSTYEEKRDLKVLKEEKKKNFL